MDNHSKGIEEGEAGDDKKPAGHVSEQETPSDRVPSAQNFANQAVAAREIDNRPKAESTSSDDTVDQTSTSYTSAVGSVTISTSVASAKGPQDGSLPPKKPKKDRSNLRKGKWTVRICG